MCARERGEPMAQKKLGRPPSDDSMTDRIFVRVDKETKAKLEECTKTLDITRSDVVRKGIELIHSDLNKK
jgi:Arc/MetJ-type ribon-helix-helix transcriptional regulator